MTGARLIGKGDHGNRYILLATLYLIKVFGVKNRLLWRSSHPSTAFDINGSECRSYFAGFVFL